MEQAMETSVNHYNDDNKDTVQIDNSQQNVSSISGDNEADKNGQESGSDISVNTDPSSGASEATTKEPEKKSEIEPPQTQEAATKVVENAGLVMSDFETEYMTNGELSKESYEKLSKAGIPKEMVDAYIEGQEARVQKIVSDMYAIAGGEQEYRQMSEWAINNVPEEDLKAYNSVMASGKKELITLAVAGMTHRYKQSVGSEPKLTQGRVSSPSKKQQGFASSAEMVKAMQDKRYGRDPAYTRMVEQKVAQSSFFG